ncbi:MAG: ABC transporter ATP-binding protein [Bacteroidetes bacterium]|nr:ABC transporter ATP-binding protein [Bacteroidota bacterium]
MLELKNISVNKGAFSLKSINFTVEKGDYFILLGVSGAGKSMVLETIAGLVIPDSGQVMLNQRDITHEKIQHRRIGLVFQDHAVFPHMTVAENVGYPLHGKHFPHSERNLKVKNIAEKMGIGSLLSRKPATLSGGELQRIALARTLIQEPLILLLDEPLASMDTHLREELRKLLRGLNKNGQTIIHVTHDYEEAISLGNKIAVIHDGEILQSGTPEEIFQNPKSGFIAHFTGVKNFFNVSAANEQNQATVLINNRISVCLPGECTSGTGYLMIRAEDILLSLHRLDSSAINNFEGVVKELIPSRSGIEVLVDIGVVIHALITRESMVHLSLEEGKTIWISFKATSLRFIPS